MQQRIFVIFAGFLLLGSTFSATPSFAKLNLVQEVDEGVWRGNQPKTKADFDEIQSKGVTLILNFQRKGDKSIAAEQKEWESRGVTFLHFPMVATETPSDETINQIFKAIEKAKANKIILYGHCTLGRDRTGLIFALYRVRYQGWTPARAYKEWKDFGFSNRFLRKIDQYFKDETGFSDSKKGKTSKRIRTCARKLAA